jgi:hypothetical protein
MKTKTFDCVEMQHRGALRIYEETKGMTVKQQVGYWSGSAGPCAPRTKARGINPRATAATARG